MTAATRAGVPAMIVTLIVHREGKHLAHVQRADLASGLGNAVCGDVVRQIGNAVPVRVAEALCGALLRQLLEAA